MLERIGIVLLMLGFFRLQIVAPEHIAVQILDHAGTAHHRTALPCAFRTMDELADIRVATVDLAAHAVHVHAVLVFEIDAEIIVLVSRHATLAAAESRRADRLLIAEEPVEHIDVMHMLLDDMIARKPLPVHPVAKHPLHVGPALLARAIPQHRLIPVNVAARDLADHALLNPLERLDISSLMMALRAGQHAQPLGLGLLSGSHDRPVTLRIHADRLFEEAVHPFLRRILEMLGTEERRRGYDHDIDARIDHVLIRIETGKAVLVGQIDLILVVEHLFEALDPVGEDIADRRNRHAVGSSQKILGGARRSRSRRPSVPVPQRPCRADPEHSTRPRPSAARKRFSSCLPHRPRGSGILLSRLRRRPWPSRKGTPSESLHSSSYRFILG